jgi:hypothetical protein
MLKPDRVELASAQIRRRDLLKVGGAAVAGVATLGAWRDAPIQDGLGSRSSGIIRIAAEDAADKPVYTADAHDPVAYSKADNLFWNDILMEHATFFVMLMPGADLETARKQAEEFQGLFATQFEQSKAIDAENYASFNQSTIDLAKRFSDYKKEMQAEQTGGKLHSLVWPLFFQHTAREADRFAKRLQMYSNREIEFERNEVIDFWATTMSEHAAFIAHLLDPQETKLIDTAEQTHVKFADTGGLKAATDDAVLAAGNEILDFKTAAEKGINAGEIKSIIRPELAAHVRREAARFIDEMKRTAVARTGRSSSPG